MNNDDINDYIPSLLNPRATKKAGDLSLTQNSIASRCSLSLKRKHVLPNAQKPVNVTPLSRQENQSKNNVLQKLENSSKNENNLISSTGGKSIVLSTSKEKTHNSPKICHKTTGKENIQNSPKPTLSKPASKHSKRKPTIDDISSIGFSAIEDWNTVRNNNNYSPSLFSFEIIAIQAHNVEPYENNASLRTASSATELCDESLHDSESTLKLYDLKEESVVSVSFGVNECKNIDLSTRNTSIKKVLISHKDNTTKIDCELIQSSQISHSDKTDENMEVKPSQSSQKRSAVAVNLEIKKKKLSQDANEDCEVLILNTNDIEKLTHVIVQPPNYKLVKRQIPDRSKFNNRNRKACTNGGCLRVDSRLKQKRIDSYFGRSVVDQTLLGSSVGCAEDVCEGAVMSKNAGAGVEGHGGAKGRRREEPSPRASKLRARDNDVRAAPLRGSQSDARRALSAKQDSGSSHSPRHHAAADSLHFSLTTKTKPKSSSPSPRNIPHYKIVAGTHFAVDAFSYGDIPNVKHYFLTHFHSDHYAGLKKSFNKLLFCSKITADLCISRLGVSSKNIHVINNDETFTVDGVQVTAVEANHCPGAIMLVFSLPTGKNVLHTGDFRATPEMESYPVFWNKDIHTIYLDTTYCNPRYDFPTQDESLEMALHLLREKKVLLEKSGKKLSSVLIVCGTYTIGKEKFFLGMARRVGCSVWACPEKDRVLRAVEGRSFSHAPARSCQLHVLPMRDLTHEKLRSYLDSLQGAFSEVVAFKPSGWENGKNSTSEKDGVTIHGIPYSEHSSFSELIRFVKFLKPKQVLPTVDISGGVKAVQKYFPCPLVCQEELVTQTKLTDWFSIQGRPHGSAVT